LPLLPFINFVEECFLSKNLQNGLTIRGDSLYCPLSLSLDSYWNCQANCHHCYLRRLNHVWGKDLRPLDVENFERTLINGLKNKEPKSPLSWALRQKKTIRFGNKADPFQPAELEHKVSARVLEILVGLNWSFLIQTMFTENLIPHRDFIIENKHLIFVQPIISPGAENDWEILERTRTTPVQERIDFLCYLRARGVSVAVNGEPFIPGYHTIKQFEDIVKRLKSWGIKNYNTYNFHFNDFVAKRLHNIGIDIEKIWHYNQDEHWKPILQKLIDIAKQNGVILGCPDFVNSGSYCEETNTCCGIDVPNPTTFNVMTVKRMLLAGNSFEETMKFCWDGVGDYHEGLAAILGKNEKVYSLKDCGIDTEQYSN